MGAQESAASLHGHDYTALPTRVLDRYIDDAEIYSAHSDEHPQQLALENESARSAGSLQLVLHTDAEIDALCLDEPGIFRYEHLATPHRVFRKGLLANVDVSVRVGPVVGRITSTTAVIMLEVEGQPGTTCECGINFARIASTDAINSKSDMSAEEATWIPDCPLTGCDISSMKFQQEGSVSITFAMEPRRPHAFTVRGLVPSTGYLVLLSGISNYDMERRVARFKTLPENVEGMRLVAISGHSAPLRSLGTGNPWHRLTHFLQRGPEVAATVHLGGTVDTRSHAHQAAEMLSNHASFKEGPRKDLERKALEVMRQAYCDTWGHHDSLRRLLGQTGAQLPVFTPHVGRGQVLKDLAAGRLQKLSDKWEARVLLRVALDTFREYQRVLWCADAPGGAAHARVDASLHQVHFTTSNLNERGIVQEQPYLAWGGVPARKPLNMSHMLESSTTTRFLTNTQEFSAAPTWSGTPTAILQEFWVDGGSAVQDVAAVEEWHFHKYGPITLLVLDTKGNFCANGIGVPDARPSLLSKRQWEALVHVLQDESTHMLILASDEPFFIREKPGHNAGNVGLDGSPDLTAGDDGGDDGNQSKPICDNLLRWRSRPEELSHLMNTLFEWKNALFPSREVLLLSGGMGFGTTGDVLDTWMGLSIPTAVTGPMFSQVRTEGPWELMGDFGDGRYTFAHRPPSKHWNACVIDVDCGPPRTNSKPSLDVQLVEIPIPPGFYDGQYIEEGT